MLCCIRKNSWTRPFSTCWLRISFKSTSKQFRDPSHRSHQKPCRQHRNSFCSGTVFSKSSIAPGVHPTQARRLRSVRYLRSLDDKLLAKRDDAVESSGLPRLLRPPYTFPPPPPRGFLSADSAVEYMANLRQYWLQRFRDYSAQAIEAGKTGPNPTSLNRLDFCDNWLMAYDAEWIRSTAAGDDFNLDVLPDNGFVDRTVIIRAVRIDDWGLSWDTSTSYDPGSNMMHRSRRVLPIPWADRQLFTELNFTQILAVRVHCTHRAQPNLQIKHFTRKAPNHVKVQSLRHSMQSTNTAK